MNSVSQPITSAMQFVAQWGSASQEERKDKMGEIQRDLNKLRENLVAGSREGATSQQSQEAHFAAEVLTNWAMSPDESARDARNLLAEASRTVSAPMHQLLKDLAAEAFGRADTPTSAIGKLFAHLATPSANSEKAGLELNAEFDMPASANLAALDQPFPPRIGAAYCKNFQTLRVVGEPIKLDEETRDSFDECLKERLDQAQAMANRGKPTAVLVQSGNRSLAFVAEAGGSGKVNWIVVDAAQPEPSAAAPGLTALLRNYVADSGTVQDIVSVAATPAESTVLTPTLLSEADKFLGQPASQHRGSLFDHLSETMHKEDHRTLEEQWQLASRSLVLDGASRHIAQPMPTPAQPQANLPQPVVNIPQNVPAAGAQPKTAAASLPHAGARPAEKAHKPKVADRLPPPALGKTFEPFEKAIICHRTPAEGDKLTSTAPALLIARGAADFIGVAKHEPEPGSLLTGDHIHDETHPLHVAQAAVRKVLKEETALRALYGPDELIKKLRQHDGPVRLATTALISQEGNLVEAQKKRDLARTQITSALRKFRDERDQLIADLNEAEKALKALPKSPKPSMVGLVKIAAGAQDRRFDESQLDIEAADLREAIGDFRKSVVDSAPMKKLDELVRAAEAQGERAWEAALYEFQYGTRPSSSSATASKPAGSAKPGSAKPGSAKPGNPAAANSARGRWAMSEGGQQSFFHRIHGDYVDRVNPRAGPAASAATPHEQVQAALDLQWSSRTHKGYRLLDDSSRSDRQLKEAADAFRAARMNEVITTDLRVAAAAAQALERNADAASPEASFGRKQQAMTDLKPLHDFRDRHDRALARVKKGIDELEKLVQEYEPPSSAARGVAAALNLADSAEERRTKLQNEARQLILLLQNYRDNVLLSEEQQKLKEIATTAKTQPLQALKKYVGAA